MGISQCKSICTSRKSHDFPQTPQNFNNIEHVRVPGTITAAIAMNQVENQRKQQIAIATASSTTSSSSIPTSQAVQVLNEKQNIINYNNGFIVEIPPNSDEFIERVVLHDAEIKENEMKEVEMDGEGHKVLLVKQNGKIFALGSKCSHYGAPLVDGVLSDGGRVRCPYHGACFNIENGDIEDFPGLDAIPCHHVKVENGLVTVRAKKSELESEKRIGKMRRKIGGGEIFVIIGGGPAAQTAAETLRINDFSGRIVMICKENHYPYDRVKISKFMGLESEKIELRSRMFYDENEIEIMLDVEATSLDAVQKEISLSTGTKLIFDKLFVATGSRARTPSSEIAGHNLKNIHTLRTIDDAHNLDELLKSTSRVIIIGSSFVAMEAAAYCSEKVEQVIVIGRSSTPFIDTFGEAIGRRIMELFTSNNVEFIMNSEIKSFLSINQEECFSGVRLQNNEIVRGDICIVGIGAQFNTDFLHESGLKINKNGSIDTNLYLQTNIDDIWVGGDIANAPIFTNKNELATVGHFSLAQYHGKIAALNMMGKPTELRTVPYFFTYFYGKIFNYVGHGKVSEIFVEGDLENLNFVGFYFDEDGFIVGMSSCQPDKSVAEFAEKLFQGRRYHKTDIEWVDAEDEELDGKQIQTQTQIQDVVEIVKDE